MKKGLTFGTLLLGCYLAASAQLRSTVPGAENQTPPQSTAPIHSQEPLPSTVPGAENQTPLQPSDQATLPSSSHMTSLQGCLSQSQAGNFVLADISGNSFQLSGNTAKLAGYIGNQVKVDGIALPARSGAGSMSSPASTDSGSSSGTTAEFSVSKIHKMAGLCATGSDTSK
jgi:hypothetical protein